MGSLTARHVVDLLSSQDTNARICGIHEARRIIADVGYAPIDDTDRLQRATLPRRLFEMLFSKNADIGREAAFALVSTSKSFKHEFVGLEQYSQLDSEKRHVLGQLIVELIAKVSDLQQLTTVEARRNGYDGNGDELLKLTIDSTRALPLEIDGKQLLLPEIEGRPNFLQISVEASYRVIGTVWRELTQTEKLEGYLLRGTADLVRTGNPEGKDRLSIAVLHPYCVEGFEVLIIE